MMLDAQMRLNDHLSKWDAEIRRFDTAVHEFGRAKAGYEQRVAVVKITAKNAAEKVAVSWLDTLADADPEAANLHLEYRGTEATVEAIKARLRWCQAVAEALRSEVATERAVAMLHADDRSTP
jgi:SAM-dependent MidA family methyltransferase